MGLLDLLFHFLNFIAPALAVGAMVAGAARVLLPRQAANRTWPVQFAINSIVGVLILAAGLWLFGVDGKMATYAALVLGVASAQWLGSRAWRN